MASFLGAATVREYVLGLDNKKPMAEELERMRKLVEREMQGGALGIGSALEYAPAYYAGTEELIELCKVAAKYKGKYITHMRSEGERLLEGIDEVIRISREARIPAEIYHFKAAGKNNWDKMDLAIAKVEAARRDGLAVTANMYVYTAGAAPLTACIPPWAMEGGEPAMRRRLRDPHLRERIAGDITSKTDWPNFYHNAASPDNIVLISFKNAALKPLQGKTLAQIASQRGKGPVETLLRPAPGRRIGHRDRLLCHGRGEHTQAAAAALDQLRFRRSCPGTRGRFPQIHASPSGLWQFRPRPGQVRPRSEAAPSRGGDPKTDQPARHQSGTGSPWSAARRQLRRRGRLRPEDDR